MNDEGCNMNKGNIVQVVGPVVDVEFAAESLPAIYNALTVEFEVDHERHGNPMRTVHGGLLCGIADSAIGIAYAITVAPGESFTTLELKINFLRPVWKAKLSARAKVVHAGRMAGFSSATLATNVDAWSRARQAHA